MTQKDAEDRFIQACHAFKDLDEKARENIFKGGMDKKAFELVLIDFDAAIPGLTGRMLGHAHGFMASCYYWICLIELREEAKASPLYDFDAARKNPTRAAGLAAAKRARDILTKIPGEDLGWIEDLIKKLS